MKKSVIYNPKMVTTEKNFAEAHKLFGTAVKNSSKQVMKKITLRTK